MPLDKEFLRLADRFLAFVKDETGFDVIVCDESGTIVRATIRSRVGTHHAFAARIMRHEVDEYAVTEEEAAANPLVKVGLNCPIVVDGVRIATFGISGKLEVTRPVGHMAAKVLATWLKELKQEEVVHTTASRVFKAIDELADRLGTSAATTTEASRVMSKAAAEAVEQVGKAGEIVSTVQRIAQQARILSINGAVEATRAGDHGRAFGVVSKDMTRLAEETRESSADIQRTLGQIARVVQEFQAAVAGSTAGIAEQGRMVEEVRSTMAELKAAVAGLEKSFGSAAAGGPAPRGPPARGRGR